MTLLYTDPLFQKHDTGRHPESPERLRALSAHLEKSGLAKRCTVGAYRPLREDELASVHAAKQVQAAKQLAEHGGGWLDGDTVLSAASFQVALAAAGAGVAAVDAVVRGSARHALCLVRPPGHHATALRSMGFCLFNNVALAARHAVVQHQLSRVLIVDWDVHHGNGTQDIFYEDPTVFFFSIHRHGNGFYPGSGAADETGRGKGQGHIFNAPIRFGCTRQTYRDCFTKHLEQAADACKPELVLLSAGFDAHARDPIGSLGLDTEDFASMTQQVLDVAHTHAGGRLVSCLEGGYHLEALADSVQAHLEELCAKR